MNFEDIKDQIRDRATALWGEIQENPTFNSLRERYETLSPNAQKGIIAGIIGVVLLILLSVPYSYFSSSSTYMTDYEEDKEIIRELLRVSRLNQGAMPIPQGLTAEALKGRVNDFLSQQKLLPEQTVGVSNLEDGSESMAKPPIRQAGVAVSLKQLNLNQILDLGLGLQNVSNSVKMAGVEVTSNPLQSGYFDVVYKLVSFSLPQEPEEPVQQRGGRPRVRNTAPPQDDEVDAEADQEPDMMDEEEE